jgi:uncharacterized membrane protein YdjX (TVP38/TMEM64 family)
MATRRGREYLTLIVIGGLLLSALFLVRTYANGIRAFIDVHDFWGVFLYFVLNIVDAVIAPGATLPLIPVAVRVWGRVGAALVTTAGWTAGSLLAFLLARRWGYPIVRKLTSIHRVQSMRRYIPEDLFWSIVLVRLVFPMDVISYVLGLFTEMTWSKYALATALGLTPAAFLLAYLGKLPNAYELISLGVGGAVVIATVFLARRKRRRSADSA